MPLNFLASIGNTIGSSITANRQNRFNRDFQAQQAQLARDWQEDFYQKYSSPSAMVQQFKDAGLNPAMMYGRGSSVVGGVPSGATPSGGSQMMPSFSLNGEIGNIIQLKEMIKNNVSQRNVNNAMASYYSDMGKKAQSDILLNNANINSITQDIKESIARTNNETEKNGLIQLEKVLRQFEGESVQYDLLKQKWENEYYDKYGVYPAENAYQAVQRYLDEILDRFGLSKYLRKKS